MIGMLFISLALWSFVGAWLYLFNVIATELKMSIRRHLFYVILAGPIVWVGASAIWTIEQMLVCLDALVLRAVRTDMWDRFGRWLDAK